MTSINVLVIPATATRFMETQQRVIQSDRLEDLQAIVDGFVERFPMPYTEPVFIIANEDGMPLALPVNELATRVLVHYAYLDGLEVNYPLYGNIVIVGFDHEAGEHASIPQSLVEGIGNLLGADNG